MAEVPVRQTFTLIKPDGVQRGLIGVITNRFEGKGLKLVGMKMTTPSEDLIQNLYSHRSDKEYFERLVTFMTSGPVVAMVWEGQGAVEACHKMKKPDPGTIRGDYTLNEHINNVIHISSTTAEADQEMGLWFPEGELVERTSRASPWL